MFQVFFVTASKPHFGLYVTLAAGFANMILDGVFLGVLGMGVDGAALATVISQTIGGVLPLVYFALPGRKALRIGKTRLNLRWLFDTVSNGLSEFLSSISSSVVGMLYNFQLLKYAGAAGVAAYGVIMYGNFIFTGVYFGYSMGIAPAVSYHYGAENTKELKGLFAKSLHIIAAFMVVLTALAEVTTQAYRIYALSFIFMGFNVFGSGFFTALNNGKISALISFGRTLVFEVIFILLLPAVFGINGIWSAVIAAESAAFVLTIACLMRYRKVYQYA